VVVRCALLATLLFHASAAHGQIRPPAVRAAQITTGAGGTRTVGSFREPPIGILRVVKTPLPCFNPQVRETCSFFNYDASNIGLTPSVGIGHSVSNVPAYSIEICTDATANNRCEPIGDLPATSFLVRGYTFTLISQLQLATRYACYVVIAYENRKARLVSESSVEIDLGPTRGNTKGRCGQ
jgi:hypothetical protein